MNRTRLVAVFAAAFLAITGCAANSDPIESASARSLAGALAAAQTAGVDKSQIDILSGDDITFTQYEAAMNRFLECAVNDGVEIVTNETRRREGQDVIYYEAVSGDETDIAMEECYTRYAHYVDAYWQASAPAALAFDERRADALQDPMATCLDGYGVDYPSDASFDELVATASTHTESHVDEDCLIDVGYDNWDG